MKKEYSFVALSALGLFPAVSAVAQNQQDHLPNIIYILTDDLGIGDLGCYGQEKIKTPTLDRLAENGVRFTQHYSGCTVSAPSRGSLLTGKHTGHAYIRGNRGQKVDGDNYDQPLLDSEITVAELLKQKNYSTACIGKWGLGGPGTEGNPNNQGFDYFFGYLGQGHAHRYYPEFLHENNEKILLNKEVYSPDLIIDKSLQFIDNNAENPFFLYYATTIPHADLAVPNEDYMDYDFGPEKPYLNGNYSDQPRPRAAYAAMVTRMDNDVKRMIDLLEEKGILENTIILFSSDNGVHIEGGNDPQFFNSNGIYRGYKRDLYEGGIRAPFIVSWPAKIKTGKVSDHPSAFWDFLPTVCEIVGVDAPQDIDGLSFLPALTGEGKQTKHDHLYWEFHEGGGKRAIVKGDWKLIQLEVNRKPDNYRLFNIAQNPGEEDQYDQAQSNPAKVKELKSVLVSSRTSNPFWEFKEVE